MVQGNNNSFDGPQSAKDDQTAIDHARDVYTRRNEGVSIWVVKSSEIIASDPAESSALFEPAADKIYRHPTFYEIPDGVENL
ncbi:MAG: 1,2-phenylacetyl-CoA epoxidase subunit B [Proteobacteria bacterium]|nr:1,2-phenylacetyl-CoA epoxidase subunit B [Pseudomonadota bacterium]